MTTDLPNIRGLAGVAVFGDKIGTVCSLKSNSMSDCDNLGLANGAGIGFEPGFSTSATSLSSIVSLDKNIDMVF